MLSFHTHCKSCPFRHQFLRDWNWRQDVIFQSSFHWFACVTDTSCIVLSWQCEIEKNHLTLPHFFLNTPVNANYWECVFRSVPSDQCHSRVCDTVNISFSSILSWSYSFPPSGCCQAGTTNWTWLNFCTARRDWHADAKLYVPQFLVILIKFTGT